MLRSGLRRRGRASTQRALYFHRGIAACTRYRVAVVRALVQILYKHLGAIFFGVRGDTRARATENLFQPLLLPPLFASCLLDYLETEIQNKALCKDVISVSHSVMTSLSIVPELRHASLRTSKYKEICAFKISCEAYQRQVEELNENRPEQEQLKPSPLEHCLDTLCYVHSYN
jgi:hypothetical protein